MNLTRPTPEFVCNALPLAEHINVGKSNGRDVTFYSGRHRAVVAFGPGPPGTGHGADRVRGQRVERARLPVRHGTVPDARAERYVGQTERDRQRLVFRPFRPGRVRVRHLHGTPTNRHVQGRAGLAHRFIIVYYHPEAGRKNFSVFRSFLILLSIIIYNVTECSRPRFTKISFYLITVVNDITIVIIRN